ncbi:insulinase family protein [Taibaiella lutea]|uniref:Insulinase family protein n=1 Tax=Taibaiella lutea TaxID=2608001 RepID=A0A5M6CQG0_9BACT|nr:insulinase family protein [Taibaiella lutea]KAA5536212.1 insulinase family protein [Taibaiella lutea]
MKKVTLSIAALALLTSVNAQTLDRSIRPQPGPAPEIKLADAQTFTLPNGLKVFVVENHKLPRVSYNILLNIHPEAEGDKTGVNEFIGQLITAGTKTLTKDQFDKETDLIGASIDASNDGMSGSSLVKHQDKLLQLMSDALMNANFQQSELDKLKKQAQAGLEQSKNEPDEMLKNVSAVLNFGKQHPYGEITTEATLGNITLADCNNYYKTYFRPNVAYLAIVGDVNFADAKKMAEKYFGKWEKANVPSATYPATPQPDKAIVQFVPREGAVQSVIGITYPIELKPGTPDVIRAKVLNEILGGSSQGRLFLNLREQHGWTYGSYSQIASDEIVGHFQAYAKARNEVTDSSVNEIINEMNNLRKTPVNGDALQNTLNYMTGTFAIGLENPSTIATYAINIDRYNMPKDYYKNYLKTLNAVTAADVQSTADKYIHADKANIVVVGDKGEAAKLTKYSTDGTINYYDYAGNPIKNEAPKAVDNSVSAATVIDNYIKATGGKTALEAIKDITMSSEFEANGAQINLIIKTIPPTQWMMSIIVSGYGEVQKEVLNGDKGYSSQAGQGAKDFDAKKLAEAKEQADLLADLHPEKYGNTLKVISKEDVDGKEAYVVETSKAGSEDKTLSYYDVASGLKVKEIKKSSEGIQISTFGDYKEIKNGNGYKMPFSISISAAGQPAQKIAFDSIEANTGLKASAFK